MGWTHCAGAKHWKQVKGRMAVDRKAELDDMFTWCQHDSRWNVIYGCRVLKSAMVGTTYYAAVERYNNRKGFRDIGAVICLTCGQTKWDDTVWGYKDMDETMGPYYYDCPAAILDMLTPTDNPTSNEWREACRKNLTEKKERKAKGKEPIFVPAGISIREDRAWWYISVGDYITRRASKRRWHDANRVVVAMIQTFGTPAMKREYAASGRECPAEWKEVA